VFEAPWGGTVNDHGSICDQKIFKFFVLSGRIHGRTHGCKGSLLKVREGKCKGELGGVQVESRGRESMLPFSRCF
jgi:hypothetical protein